MTILRANAIMGTMFYFAYLSSSASDSFNYWLAGIAFIILAISATLQSFMALTVFAMARSEESLKLVRESAMKEISEFALAHPKIRLLNKIFVLASSAMVGIILRFSGFEFVGTSYIVIAAFLAYNSAVMDDELKLSPK